MAEIESGYSTSFRKRAGLKNPVGPTPTSAALEGRRILVCRTSLEN